MEPSNPDSISNLAIGDLGPERFDGADDLVAWNDGRLNQIEIPLHDMQIGAANAAHMHFDQDLVGRGLGAWDVVEPQRMGFDRCLSVEN